MKLLIILLIYIHVNISAPEVYSPIQRVFQFVERYTILPGTRWCGLGQNARSGRDLGQLAKTDNCCRNHDLCPDNILQGQSKHGLTNRGWYTRSHCNCDREFYRCLKAAGNAVSFATGTTYFSILGPQCFQRSPPIIGCLQEEYRRCIKYGFQENLTEIWQWLDNPVF